ncbi:MAG: aminotransferase class V-fold PLP-dependent enzyme [Pseudomonadales bacterium]|nr:aminotransferase class V-fold PLP-dependent enzyme [Pseudomonadales bacterium]
MTLLSLSVRNDFPLLEREVGGKKIVYLDSSATSLKPQRVIDAVVGFYTQQTANVHRSVHLLSEEATDAYEMSRKQIASLVGADAREIAFTKNATEALNLLAINVDTNNLVGLPQIEHHSNLLPWIHHRHFYLPLDEDKRIDIEALKNIVRNDKPYLLTFATVSNALGIKHPVQELLNLCRAEGIKSILDLSQSVGHETVNLFSESCDFACFSGHKMLGPSGVGVLYQREGTSPALQPHYLGGEMVHQVHLDGFEARPFPWGMESGTPNIEGVIGLGAAAEYLEEIGTDAIAAHCNQLADELRHGISKLPRVKLQSNAADTGIVTFEVEGLSAHGVSRIMSNRFNIMVRSGFHCAQPLHELYEMPETVRASFHLYNTQEEVQQLLEALAVVQEMS